MATARLIRSRLAKVDSAKTLLTHFWTRETAAFAAASSHSLSASSSTSESVPPTPAPVHNPFVPRLNPLTKRWAPPKYSLRRQANLVKSARLLGVESLLPLGPKSLRVPGGTPVPPAELEPEETLGGMVGAQPLPWVGEPKPVKARGEKGLYTGRRVMFKGHKWERELPAREARLHNFNIEATEAKLQRERNDRILNNRSQRKKKAAGLLL